MNTQKNKLYLTTPIYTANDKPHIGHAYTTILTDALARYSRLFGYDTFFVTGTDEHGQKIQKAAVENGKTPHDYCESLIPKFQELWERLNISNNDFIRTTQERHEAVVRKILIDFYNSGEIYKGLYSGWYCIPCERFFSESDLLNGKCPECDRDVEKIEETGYFFRMSKYQDWLIRYIKDHPDFIRPDFRCNETLGFLRRPLGDLCISRPKSRVYWGIELPFDKDYVCYVWFDALINYISAVKYLSDEKIFHEWWPADYHLIGKDILTTHTVYWPIMLKATGIELPKTIFAHGWWIIDGSKMSKSKGNVIDPLDFIEEFGADAFRYYVLAEMAAGQDASFNRERFIERYNSDLANNFGNLANRILKLIESTTNGKIPNRCDLLDIDIRLQLKISLIIPVVKQAAFEVKIHTVIENINSAVKLCNQYLENTEPWKLKSDLSQRKRLETVLYTTLEALRIISGLLFPIIPGKMTALRRIIGLEEKYIIPDIHRLKTWDLSIPGKQLHPIKSLFPRIAYN